MQTSNMIKASKIAIAVATLMAAQSASAFDVYVSGASALRDTMPRLLNRFCQTSGRAVAEVGATAAAADKDRRVYSCTFHTAATNAAVAAELGAGLVGKQVNVYHSVEPGNSLDNAVGGSITGIIPLLAGSSNTLLNFAVKGGTANGTDSTFVGAAKTFTTQVPGVPQIGLTDVEPSKFTAAYGNVPTDPAAIAAGWTISGSQDPASLVNEVAFVGGFGVAVSKNLLNAGITNISQDQLAAVLSGDVGNWNQIGGPDLPVRVCRRAPGSGTQATFNAVVSRKGCGANVNAFEYIVGDATNPQITENATTGLVKSCLTAANTAGVEGAIGILGLENNAVDATVVNGVATQTWQLIDINGVKIWDTTESAANTVDGTADNIREEKIISGQYPLAVESTVVKSQKVALTADQLAFYTLLKDKAGDPIFTKTLPGVVSDSTKTSGNLPNLNEGATNFTRGGDTCNPLSLSL